jgi:hypothetical protein
MLALEVARLVELFTYAAILACLLFSTNSKFASKTVAK